MSTVVKSYRFLSTNEGFVEVGDSAISLAHDSGGNPGGSLEFLGAASGTTERIRSATGETWETWGVPAGATVTSVQITAIESKFYNTGASRTGTLTARVVDATTGTTVHAAGDLFSRSIGTGADGAWVNGAPGTSRAVDSGKQASTTGVRFEIQLTISGADPGYDLGIDNIDVTITYTAGSGDANTTAPAADGTGDLPDPAMSADATVTAPAADGTGQLPMSGISSEVVSPPLTGGGGIPSPGVSGTGDATVTAPVADGVGDLPDPAAAAGATVTAPAADGTGDLPDPTLPGAPAAALAPVWVGRRPRVIAPYAQLTRRRR